MIFSGWIVFVIAAFVYGMTIEPTVSFLGLSRIYFVCRKVTSGASAGCTFLYACWKLVYSVCFRPVTSVPDG